MVLAKNSSVVTSYTQEPGKYSHLFHVLHGTKATLGFLAADVATSKFGLLISSWHSATRKQMFLYPQDDW